MLSRLFIFCNSFSNLKLRTPSRVFEREVRYIYLACEFVLETPLEVTSERYSDVFNDCSLHSFPSLPHDDWPEWKNSEGGEPVYDQADIEFVKGQHDGKQQQPGPLQEHPQGD